MEEEADLLKERLQAITDKRKLQEDIAKKRREIEEEKLRLQYIKKKTLRDQWLMDGVSQQSEEEQQVLRLQAEDEQQLQSNILRIEKDIEALETQELSISSKEEIILKRLKEVERTAEDIIKELNVTSPSDVTHQRSSPAAETNNHISTELKRNEQKKASFAIKISVEHNKKTGKSEIVSTATISPETIQQKGLKVYEDGQKSVYALKPDGEMSDDGGEKMTFNEVEELLHRATVKTLPPEVHYHQPIYSLPFKGTSGPSTHGGSKKTHIQSLGSQQDTPLFPVGAQPFKPDDLCCQEQKELGNANTSRVQRLSHQDLMLAQLANVSVSGEPDCNTQLQSLIPEPVPPIYRTLDENSKNEADLKFSTESSDLIKGEKFLLNLVNAIPEGLESKAVTMTFMGYEQAVVEEDEDVQAELIMLGNSDDDDDDDDEDINKNDHNHENHRCDDREFVEEAQLSYHPEGYKSKVFTPKMCQANVVSSDDSNWDDLELYKPTFMHKCGVHSVHILREEKIESANLGSVSLENVTLCVNNDTLPHTQYVGC